MRLPTYKIVMPLFLVAAAPLAVTGHWWVASAVALIGVLYSWQEWLSGQARLTGEDWGKMHGAKCTEYEIKTMMNIPPIANKQYKEDLANGITLEDIIGSIQQNDSSVLYRPEQFR